MRVIIKGNSGLGNWLRIGFITVILLSMAKGEATASFPIAPGINNRELSLQSHLPILEQATGLNTELPSSVNPISETRLTIKLRERRVYVYQGDRVQASYQIAIGRAGWETPTGNFRVIQKIEDPAWEHPWTGEVIPPGPNNPLGTRWIAFWTDGKNSIGFHGTPNERLIGQAVSHGCIRMRNRDAIALYELVKIGTPVTVQR